MAEPPESPLALARSFRQMRTSLPTVDTPLDSADIAILAASYAQLRALSGPSTMARIGLGVVHTMRRIRGDFFRVWRSSGSVQP